MSSSESVSSSSSRGRLAARIGVEVLRPVATSSSIGKSKSEMSRKGSKSNGIVVWSDPRQNKPSHGRPETVICQPPGRPRTVPHFQFTVPYAVAMSTQDGMEGRPVAVQEGR